jgi:hypothetical protein
MALTGVHGVVESGIGHRGEANGREPSMSQLVPATDAQWRVPGQLLAELTDEDQPASWAEYVRRLEATDQVRFVAAGEHLVARKVYIDLHQPCKGPFRALEGQMAGSRTRYLDRDEVPDHVWCAIVEHCACVDRRTGVYAPLEDLPSRRLAASAASPDTVVRQAFAA